MMLRAVTCLALLASAALVRAQDAREIVRRAADHYERNFDVPHQYTYLQRQETRELDHAGRVQNRKIETSEILFLEGSPYRRLVARDDRPISSDEQKGEEDKLLWAAGQRRMETSEQRARRVGEYQRRQDREREPVHEVADAFNFKLLGQEQFGGRTVYRVEGTPKPGFKPKSQFAAIFPKVNLQLWIDKDEEQPARVEMDILEPISFGGFLVRLTKGSRLVVEQTRIPEGVWVPKQFTLTAAARILLVKGLNREMDYRFSDYKKITVPPDVVALARQR